MTSPQHANSQKIIVGLSGGVDSSVAALRLLQQGYQVEGLFMKNWQDDDGCPAEADLIDAERVCDRLRIPLHVVNFSHEYWHHVFQHFLDEYQAGRTPNPDVWCNKEIKFKAFLDYAKSLGADSIATGHYARIKTDIEGRIGLYQAIDASKDQSYFLYLLTASVLKQTLFPVGDIEKHAVRELAKTAGLLTHNKKDSTGICFIGERKFRDFLNQYLPAKPGLIQTLAGETIGEHQGVMYYTRGQRQGLGIGGHKAHVEAPWYVADKDIQNNILYVVQGHDHPSLFHQTLIAKQCHWVNAAPEASDELTAKIRYRHAACACKLTWVDAVTMRLDFVDKQWAITPGQSVVLYQGEQCLGGGVIETFQ